MKTNKHLLWTLVCLIATFSCISTTSAQIINSSVAFQETGLPPGTIWGVLCNGTMYTSNSTFISITILPGTYNYSISNVSGYTASPQSGNVTAILDPVKLNVITFTSSVPEFVMNPTVMSVFALTAITFLVAIASKKTKKRNVASLNLNSGETSKND